MDVKFTNKAGVTIHSDEIKYKTIGDEVVYVIPAEATHVRVPLHSDSDCFTTSTEYLTTSDEEDYARDLSVSEDSTLDEDDVKNNQMTMTRYKSETHKTLKYNETKSQNRISTSSEEEPPKKILKKKYTTIPYLSK